MNLSRSRQSLDGGRDRSGRGVSREAKCPPGVELSLTETERQKTEFEKVAYIKALRILSA